MTAFKPEHAIERRVWNRTVAKVCQDTYQMRRLQKMDYGTAMYKTYLVEAYEDRKALSNKKLRQLVEEIVRTAYPRAELDLQMMEERFFFLQIDNTAFVLEAQHPRFWRLETFEDSRQADAKVRKLLSRGNLLDKLWVPSSLQLGVGAATEADIRGLSTEHFPHRNRDRNKQKKFSEDEARQGLKISGANAKSRFERLRKFEDFGRFLAVVRTELRSEDMALIETEDEGPPEPAPVALASIWYHGKITSRGTWFGGISTTISALVSMYSRGIDAVEKQSIQLQRRTESVFETHGSSCGIELTHPISPDEFQEQVLENEAFKLLATWAEVRDGSAEYDVVDLHTGDQLEIALTSTADSSRLSVSLGGDACANAVPRLLTNLQQFVDATATCPVFEEAALE